MKWLISSCLLILAATAAGAAFRLPALDSRPMHCDEAVHAVKFGDLLEKGSYRYEPHEYHGPTLNYLTLIPAWLSGADELKDLGEFTVRIVPVFFGVALVLLFLLLTDGLGRPAAVIAALLTAVSPAFVFYSRYYIQEMLLVCFSFGVIVFAYRWFRSRRIIWALLTGVSLGLAHATKETFIIALGSMLLALVLTWIMHHRRSVRDTVTKIRPVHLVVLTAAAVGVSALFYSSFFSNPGGVLDSFRTYGTYFSRASQASVHIHPWHYYLKTLVFCRYGDGPVWTEALIVLLAVVGFIAAVTRKGIASVDFALVRFVAFYTLIMTVVYSAIPYKTPWCLLGFLNGMIVLAAVGAVVVVRLTPKVLPRLIVICLLVGASLHLAWQSYQGNYRYYADSRNPYVYAHPTEDVIAVGRRIEELAEVDAAGHDMLIQVICPDDDYWPLPWYLRRFSRVGWWNRIPDTLLPSAVIVVAAEMEPALAEKIYGQDHPQPYLSMFHSPVQLRPQIELRCYVAKDLWDRYQASLVNLIPPERPKSENE